MTRLERPVVGVLGGTFDPVHHGHLGIAQRVIERTGFKRLWLLPSALPPHKDSPRVTPAVDRVEMLRLAILDRPIFEICSLEVDRGEVCYTIDTLRQLRDGNRPVLPVFIMGMDSLVELPTWKDFRSLIREFDLVAVDRPGSDAAIEALHPEVAEAIEELPRDEEPPWGRGRIYRLRIPPIPISSSQIRAMVARGESPSGLVPPGVARYIHDNRLYREEELR